MSSRGFMVCSLALISVSGCEAPAPATDHLTIAAPALEAPPLPAPVPLLYAGGFGPLTIGMTRDEVIALAGEPDAPLNPVFESEACETFSPANFPKIELMFENGLLSRVTLDSDFYRTDKDFGVNSGAAEIKAAYGDALKATQHEHAAAPAEYLTVWEAGEGSSPDSRGLRFETDDEQKVAFVHGGGPSIQYIEGCS